MTLFVEFEWADVDQYPLGRLHPLNKVLDREETKLKFRLVVEAFELPPTTSEKLVVRQGFHLLHMALHVEYEVAHDEALGTPFHHFKSLFDQLFNAHQPCNVVDNL